MRSRCGIWATCPRLMNARNVTLRYLGEALTGAAPGAIDELVADDALRRRTERFVEAFPGAAVEIDVLFGDGDLVAAHFTARGTHRGLWNGVPPTGNEWEARCTAIYRVLDGRIAEAWVTWDLLALMEQLDAIERVQSVSA
jgi:predicted ester cyclase